MVDRGAHWQCGYVVRNGSFADVKARGSRPSAPPSPRFAAAAERVQEVTSWQDVHLLTVRIDRLKRWWRPGVLCIGDAAHAMSPIGGVGVNSRFRMPWPRRTTSPRR